MNQYRRLLNNTFIFAIGTFSSKLLVFFMMRFYTGYLSPDEMGIADLITKTTNILFPIVSVSIGQAVIRFGLERKNRKSDVFTVGLLTIAIGFCISLFFMPILNLIQYNTSEGNLYSLMPYALLIYTYVLTSCVQNLCGQFIRACDRIKLYAIDGIFRTLMTILFNILFLAVFGWRIFGYVFSIICADALSTVCLFFIARLHRRIKFKKPNFHLWKSMLSYSLPLVPAAILVFIIGFSDQLFLARMRNTAESGLYAVAYRIPTMISLVASIFVDAWQISSINNNAKSEQVRFFSKVGNTYSAIVFIVASGAILCAKLAISILAAPNYYIAWTYVPILAFGACFSCLSSFQNSVYTLEKKTFQSFCSTALSALTNIVLNYLLIPKFGGNGAAFATLVSYCLLFLYRCVDSRRFLPVRWNYRRLILNTILLSAQTLIMLREPTGWILIECILFALMLLFNARELLAGAKKLLRRS